jgi:uncharacterized repeat protein (TIGR01451 family)
MDANGANPTRLTTNPGFDDQPAWSPDGTRIAFSRDGANVFVMNADGTGQTNLTGGVGTINAQPNWSPDGTRIAFSSDRAGTLDIFVMNANGSAPTQVTTDPASDDQPAWSPDGTRIAFTSDRAGTFDILTVNPDGTGTTNLTSAGAAVDVEPNWQPLPPDLAITITDVPDPAGVGQPITYTVTVRNVSSASAPAVIVTNTLPAGVTFTSATPSQGSCGAVANGVFTCALGSLGANAQATISVVVVPNSAGTLTYSASVAASAADRNTADNAATASTTVTASPAAPPVPPAARARRARPTSR